MIYKFFDIDTLNEELTAKYFPLLSETRRNLIAALPSAYDRSVAFCSEILARQCLNEMFHSPEFSFKLLLAPNGKSAVGNFDAQISLAEYEGYLGCAVSKKSVGIALCPAENTSFNDLQKLLTDKELRDALSFSRYSFTEIMKKQTVDEREVCACAAVFLALKQSYFRAKGKVLNNNNMSVEFIIRENSIECSDKSINCVNAGFTHNNKLAYAITEVE